MFLRAKEGTVSPVDGTKLTKEWMTELIQDEGDDRSGSGRKSKRSMDSDEEDANEVEMAAKQRAVDLLKTYIELQEEENRHLTQALNLTTLAGRVNPTGGYSGSEVWLGIPANPLKCFIRPCIAMTQALNLATLAGRVNPTGGSSGPDVWLGIPASPLKCFIRPFMATTQALNLATLAQTQRTDRYLDGVVATIVPTFPCFPRLSASRESRTHAVQRQCSKHVN